MSRSIYGTYDIQNIGEGFSIARFSDSERPQYSHIVYDEKGTLSLMLTPAMAAKIVSAVTERVSAVWEEDEETPFLSTNVPENQLNQWVVNCAKRDIVKTNPGIEDLRHLRGNKFIGCKTGFDTVVFYLFAITLEGISEGVEFSYAQMVDMINYKRSYDK